ncbi:MAG: ABC transporter ATP-binding protein [Mangrovibacterium sp.]
MKDNNINILSASTLPLGGDGGGSGFFSVKDLSCGYPSFAIKEVNFSIAKGSFTGIIGPNGSGKTTLFKGITSSLKWLNGEITLAGRNLKDYTLKERAQHIAIVSQSVDVGEISVQDYVLMGRMPYQSRFQLKESVLDLELAEKYMELTGVLDYRYKIMTELSGGEQQRAAIARALTQEPDLLLLDEPTSNLDIKHQVRILNLLQQLNEEAGLTVLMVIHDLNLASEYCNQLLLFKKGGIYKQGTPQEIITFENIEEVYQTPVITQENPYSKKPAIFLVSEKMMQSLRGDKP